MPTAAATTPATRRAGCDDVVLGRAGQELRLGPGGCLLYRSACLHVIRIVVRSARHKVPPPDFDRDRRLLSLIMYVLCSTCIQPSKDTRVLNPGKSLMVVSGLAWSAWEKSLLPR